MSVTEVGPSNAPGVLFLHGIGQGQASFRPQFESNLARKYRMVAFDLRGHGASGKPWNEQDYTSPATWAGDVVRVMEATGLRRPVVVAWSYGSTVAADLIRVEGGRRIAGLVLVGALGGFVAQPARSGPLSPVLAEANRLQRSARAEDNRAAARLVVPMLSFKSPAAEWVETATFLGGLVPAFAQQGLRKHAIANQDLATRLNMPVLIIYGAHDGSVPAEAVERLLRDVPTARASRFEDAGHSPFAEEPQRFNAELSEFIDGIRP